MTNTPHIKGTAKSAFVLEWDGKASDLITLTDEFAFGETGEGLDSLDMGDVLGFWEWHFRVDCDNMEPMVITMGKNSLTLSLETALFEWEGDINE